MPLSVNNTPGDAKKYLVAFSFAGEDRGVVLPIAKEVERRLGSETVFYDSWYEADLGVAGLDLKLQRIYGKECELAVPCVSKTYGEKAWPLTEFAAIRNRLFEARVSTDKIQKLSVFPIRVAEGEVEGIMSIDGLPDVREKSPEQAADLIIRRLHKIRPDLKLCENATQAPPQTPSGKVSNVKPTHLHYLCDRSEQEEALTQLLSETAKDGLNRPLLVIVHGDATEAHAAFIDRMCRLHLPSKFKNYHFTGEIQIVRPSARLMAKTTADLSQEVRKKLAQALQIEPPSETDEKLLESLGRDCAAIIAPVFDMSCREAFIGEKCYVQMLIECWKKFPNLPKDRALIVFICVKYLPPEPVGFLAKTWPFKKTDCTHRLRELINELGHSPDDESVRYAVLPELKPVTVEDVDRWFQSQPVAAHIQRPLLTGAIQSQVFKGQYELPMEYVLEALESYISSPPHPTR